MCLTSVYVCLFIHIFNLDYNLNIHVAMNWNVKVDHRLNNFTCVGGGHFSRSQCMAMAGICCIHVTSRCFTIWFRFSRLNVESKWIISFCLVKLCFGTMSNILSEGAWLLQPLLKSVTPRTIWTTWRILGAVLIFPLSQGTVSLRGGIAWVCYWFNMDEWVGECSKQQIPVTYWTLPDHNWRKWGEDMVDYLSVIY